MFTLVGFVFQEDPTKNQNMRNASRDSLQFSFGDLISFNNHSSFSSCLCSITEKTTLSLFSDEAKSQRVSRLQLQYVSFQFLCETTSKDNENHDNTSRFGLMRNRTSYLSNSNSTKIFR